MKSQDIILLAGAAVAVWWVLKTYGGDKKTAAAAPKYWVTGGQAIVDQYSTFPDPGVQGGVWV